MYNDELTARKWALNSAVECHLHTSSRFNTFNNLTRLRGTAKYLEIHGNTRALRVQNAGTTCTIIGAGISSSLRLFRGKVPSTLAVTSVSERDSEDLRY